MLTKLLFSIVSVGVLTAEIPYSLEPLLKHRQVDQKFHVNNFWNAMEWGREATSPEFYSDKDVLKAKENFDYFCDHLEQPAQESSIPHLIHLIWLGSPISEKVSACFDSWKKHHPLWEIKIWNDNDIPEFDWSCEHSKTCFQQADTWAEKADIFRLEVLYKFGGLYSDADVVCLNSFDPLTNQGLGFFSCFELNYVGKHYGEPFFVGSAILGAKQGSYVMKYCLDHLTSKIESPEEGIIKRTGPGLISRACQMAFSNSSEHILILPCSYLYPLPWKKRETTSAGVLEYVSPDTLAIHLWDGSWCTHKKKKPL